MNLKENQINDIDPFIKKMSIQLYIISKEIENIKSENQKELSVISKKITKLDKELLKKFNIKLSDSTKESALELFKILK